ncbi:MAG: DUF501 domain-containing protein [Actinomycetota bacterium]
MSAGALSAADIAAVRAQLGREPTTVFSVVARCLPDGHPLVIRNAPYDAEGKPFPTRYWLTCPEAVRAVSTLEASGAVRRWNERLDTDAEFVERLSIAHMAYAGERDREAALWRGGGRAGDIVAPALDAPTGGIGGTRTGVKCLHAHYAYHLAGGVDPIGSEVAREVEPIHGPGPRPHVVAAIDQGTNSTRLLVLGEAVPGGPAVELARDMEITQLGRGVDGNGRLYLDAIARSYHAVGRFARRAEVLGASRVVVSATSAVRDAENRDEWLRWMRKLGPLVEAEVLSGDAEAARTFAGAIADAPGDGPFLVIDIGGGSTEFVLGDRDGVRAATSTQMGSVRLTERCVRSDPVTPGELDALRDEVHRVLEEVERAVPVRAARTVLAVAGTTTTVQGIALGLPRYDPDLIHGSKLTLDDARAVLARLAAEDREARAAHPVMPRGREEVIVAGAVILVESLARFGFDGVTVSEHDILDGLGVAALRGR